MTEQERKYWIWLASVENVGMARIESLLGIYGSAFEVFRQAPGRAEELNLRANIGEKTAQKVAAAASERYFERLYEVLDERGISIATIHDEAYPDAIREIANPPPVLYYYGDIALLREDKAMAVVGTRRPSRYGRAAALDICAALAQAGVMVVSGMARGIDAAAHEGALKAGGKTIAVLGCGVDVIYPPDNRVLYETIRDQGLIISEFIPNMQPLAGNFPRRNRIISALGRGLLVVEAGERSGSSITVGFAQEQGRDVFAVPGNITSPGSVTPNRLIKEGCEVVTRPEDILFYYGWDAPGNHAPQRRAIALTGVEKLVVDQLAQGDMTFDELYESMDISMPGLYTLLDQLMEKGAVVASPGRTYGLNLGG